MKKLFPYIIVISFVISCGKSHQGNMIVKGNIDGLKKGTLYLQKIQDTLLVNVDSIQLNGNGSFVLSDNVESPELYYITLDEVSSEKIPFFGEKGEITITSKLDRLATSAKITGSANQLILDEFKEVFKKFNNKQLDLIKEKFDAMKTGDADAQLTAEDAEKRLREFDSSLTREERINREAKRIADEVWKEEKKKLDAEAEEKRRKEKEEEPERARQAIKE